MTRKRERTRRIQKEKGRILKQLISKSIGKSAGRNSSGRITSFHRGGGLKLLQRKVDLKRNTPATGVVEQIEHDPNRSSCNALVRWTDGVDLSRRLGQKEIEEIRENLVLSASSKTLESPVFSIFSFSSVAGRVDQRKLVSCSLQAKCLPRNYVMIGQASATRVHFSSPFSMGETETATATATAIATSLTLGLPRIAVTGAKPSFFRSTTQWK